MADNVAVTPGAGATLAADDVGGILHQRTKVSLGADGSATDLLGTAAAGAFVDPHTNLQHLQLTFTPVLTNFGTLYTTGDCLGTLTTVSGAARTSGSGGVIQGIMILDKTQAQRSAFDIAIFNSTVTTAADNAAFTVSDADAAKMQAYIPVLTTDYAAAWPGTPNNSIAYLPPRSAAVAGEMSIPYLCSATSLFIQLIVRGAPTYTSTSDLVIILDTLQD
jgi:hypothetical protein